MGYNSKFKKVNDWIKDNIKPSELKIFDNNFTKCEYVFSKLPLELLNCPISINQIYQLLYKLKLITSKNKGDKNERLNWIIKHKNDILNIKCCDSKQTNILRIDYVMKYLNQELKTDYTKNQIRNFLNNQNLLSKYFTMKNLK